VVYRTLSDGLTEHYQVPITPNKAHKLMKKFFMPHVDSGLQDKNGEPIMLEMSTTELCRSGSESSFQDYVERVQEFAAHKGIYIPDPGEMENE